MIATAMLLCLVAGAGFAQQAKVAPTHGRPFFMPEWRRQQILQLKQKEAWAQKAYGEAQRAALAGLSSRSSRHGRFPNRNWYRCRRQLAGHLRRRPPGQPQQFRGH